MNKLTCTILTAILIGLFVFLYAKADAEIYSSISGYVLDEDTKQGVAGVQIVCFPDRYRATTDEKGFFIIKKVTSGTKYLKFHKDDSPYMRELKPLEIIVPKGKNVINVNYSFKRGGSVTGTVYAADGVTPLNANVTAYCNNDNFDSIRGNWTDSNGKYLIYLPQSDNCIAELDVMGHAVMKKQFSIKKNMVTDNINFTVKWDDITGISGYVLDADGKPVSDADIYLKDNTGEDSGFTHPDETGYYSIVGVKPGIYSVSAFLGGGKIIKKSNISILSGKSTEVILKLENTSSTSWLNKLKNIINIDKLFSFFVSEVFASVNGFPDPKWDPAYVCDAGKEEALSDAYKDLTAFVRDKKCSNMTDLLQNKLAETLRSRITVGCAKNTDPVCQSNGAVDCASADAPGSKSLYCERAFSGCGNCLASTMLHEIIHNTGAGAKYNDEKGECIPYQCEDDCCKSICPSANCPNKEDCKVYTNENVNRGTCNCDYADYR